ncbi:eRF1 methyltransferase catalytic subunit MTQ2 [Candida tropicalis]
MLPTPIIGKIDYEKVYEPSEDSFLLLDCFEQEKDFIQAAFKESIPFVTEIGTGSGIIPEIPTQDEDPVWLDLALVGGEDGMVVTWKVLDCLEQTLSSNGIAYILFCARNKPESVAEIMRERGWNVEVVIHRKAGWEVLSVLKFSKGK